MHSVRSLPQNGQIARGYQCGSSHAVQRLIRSLPWAAASQNGFVSGLTGGGGIVRALPAISLSPHDQRGTGVAGRERAAGTVSESDVAVLHLYFWMRLAPELAHRLDHLGEPAAVARVVVAEAAAIGGGRQPTRPRERDVVSARAAATG